MAHMNILLLVISSLLLGSTNAHDFIKYGYNGGNGADKWGSLSSDFSLCSQGKQQSPININKNTTNYDLNLKQAPRNYVLTKATLINNGINIMLKYDQGAGNLTLDGKSYAMTQMIWHSPAEHTIDGQSFPVELQLIHQSSDNHIAVVAILYQYGSPDAFLLQIQDELEQLARDKCTDDQEARVAVGVVQTRALERRSRKFFRYVGSLTAPPCTEDVTWIILGKVREMTKEQAASLKAPLSADYQSNARPIQLINGRTVQLYDELHNVKKAPSSKSD
ncbi:alpha carbonic anhydrase 1, chloroplastic-like [Zingiber officinale]|uniref:alpha carbonic anhydrase 1, chloroplastic-like n=1 Tax=Zingiber officinale TaxID=94328 RepID=UPI001C4D4C79|nr:alpha carbonic anhydrase 1, chloroplastic-like [Zingiber officinale]